MGDWRTRALRPLKLGRSRTTEAPHDEAPEREMDPRAAGNNGPVENSVIDAAVYVDGRRRQSLTTLSDTFGQLRRTPGSMAWIGLYRPTADQLQSLAAEFGLHELVIEDTVVAHQRPKLERYGDTLFVVLRAARYLDDIEEVGFGELHVFIGREFVITVRHGESPNLAQVRRIYELSREVIEFRRATRPLIGMLHALTAGFDKYGIDEELRSYLRDVADHATTVVERVDGFRQMLQDILTVNATLLGQAQNEEMKNLTASSYAQNEEIKKISAWAAILFAPTLIGTVYGMNFNVMPELHWALGYPFALGLMAAVCGTLFAIFKRRRWL